MKPVTAAEPAPVVSTTEQAGPSGAFLAEQEERGEESFEATIVRLDGLSLEQLVRQAEEW